MTTRILIVVMSGIFLAACENPYLRQFKDEFGWTEASMLKDGWLEGRRIPSRPVYCYETLANPDCFSSPRKDQDYRLATEVDEGNF